MDDEILNVKNIFLNLGYPDDIIYSTILKTRTKFEKHTVKFGLNKCPFYLNLPYTANLLIQNNLKKIVNTCYHSVKLRLVYKTKKLFEINNKDKVSMLNNSNVVYKFVCSCNKTYMGRTSNNLLTRINQHLPNM